MKNNISAETYITGLFSRVLTVFGVNDYYISNLLEK
jgi:hypothetical protein